MNVDALVAWVASHAIAVLVGVVILILIYRFAQPLMHRVVSALLKAQQATLDVSGAPADELHKRATTLENLLARLIRLAVFGLLIMLILSVFDLWPMLAGLGLIAAALTIAGQAIILDYLMGVLILVEGQYYNGDWISVDGPNSVLDGEVEEVGLRRTVLRNSQGVVHSISNGIIRSPSNMTRVYAMAVVDMLVPRAGDLDRAIEVANAAGVEMARDPAWSERVIEAPQFLYVIELTLDGARVRVRGRVRPGEQWAAAGELRRRLAVAFAAAGIDTVRWDLPATGGSVFPPGGSASQPIEEGSK